MLRWKITMNPIRNQRHGWSPATSTRTAGTRNSAVVPPTWAMIFGSQDGRRSLTWSR
ncbi:hypothetical protein BB170200_03521 [Mycobacterium marinum]|nr:hypothetical protein BB170200_03521 [Mycobacterium marinum]